MTWITASLLMFFSQVIFYLLVRKAQTFDIPTEFINFFSSLVALLVYFLIAFNDKSFFTITSFSLLIIFLLSIFGSYLPNVASINSIKFAPNPGYSLVISKSYVVFTALVAVLFFHSSLTIKSGIAIILIIGFSILVTVGKSKPHKHSNSLWLPFALVAFFGYGILSLGSKYLLTIGVTVNQRLIFLAIFITIYAFGEITFRKTKIINISFNKIFILLMIGIFFASANYFNISAIDKAPNIGYVNAINASSVSLITLLSALFYKDDLSIKKFIGVIGVIGGLILLLI